MNSQRISHTHLQFAQKSQQHKPKIAKEYVLPTLKTEWKKKKRKPNNVYKSLGNK